MSEGYRGWHPSTCPCAGCRDYRRMTRWINALLIAVFVAVVVVAFYTGVLGVLWTTGWR